MFTLNGYVECSEIDYYTNSFYIYHDFGNVKSATKSFAFELNGVSEVFRPSSVVFRDGCIKVSIGSYRFSNAGRIRYSFNALKLDSQKVLGYSPDLYFNIIIISTSTLYAKMTIRGIIPGDVNIESDIEFDMLQHNRNPLFYWETPSRNADESNSLSEEYIGKDISGYYYSFNREPSYFIRTTDNYISSNETFVRFPSSGSYYFHIRAINTAGNLSRNTSSARVIYNNPPSSPRNLCTNFESYYSGSLDRSIFSWYDSSNSDSDSISYEIEIYKNGKYLKGGPIETYKCKESILTGMMNIYNSEHRLYCKMDVEREDSSHWSDLFGLVSVYKNKQSRDEEKTYYLFEKNRSDMRRGEYYYRVRGYDWAEQSEWSNECYFEIYGVDSFLASKMWIGYPDSDRSLSGKLFIYGDSSIYGKMYFIPSLIGKLIICELGESSELYGELLFKEFISLYGKMEIESNFSDIYGMLYISCKPGYSNLFGKLRLVYDYDSVLYGGLIIREFDYGDLSGEMFIHANGKSGLYGEMFLIRERLCGKMNIYRNYNNDEGFPKYRGILTGLMSIYNYPPEPIVTSDVGHDWQNSKIVNFSWTIEQTNINVVAYGYYISNTKITDFSSISFLRTSINSVQVNLENKNGSGEYYFYVYSISSTNSKSYNTEYIVRYNNIPSIPGADMKINNQECISNVPIVSRNEHNIFSWIKSSHLDQDIVKYNIQISDDINFSNIIIDKMDIYNNNASSYIDFEIQYNYPASSNLFYWRVRSYDKFQYSDFGYIGRFRCNTKPGVPTNLSVENEV